MGKRKINFMVAKTIKIQLDHPQDTGSTNLPKTLYPQCGKYKRS